MKPILKYNVGFKNKIKNNVHFKIRELSSTSDITRSMVMPEVLDRCQYYYQIKIRENYDKLLYFQNS